VANRKSISFQVVIDKKQWLSADPSVRITKVEDEAATFELWVSPLAATDVQIEMASHELAGGLDAYLDLEEGSKRAHAAIRAQIVQAIWPKGVPEVETPEEIDAFESSVEAAWAADTSRQKMVLSKMRDMLERINFIAAWPYLVKSVPAGWESLANMDMAPAMLSWMRRAHANELETHLEGKD